MKHSPLPSQTILHGRYIVLEYSSSDKVSYWYQGADLQTGEEVRIREYFQPQVMARQEDGHTVGYYPKHKDAFFSGREAFASASRQAASQNPNLLTFKENHTYYLIRPAEEKKQSSPPPTPASPPTSPLAASTIRPKYSLGKIAALLAALFCTAGLFVLGWFWGHSGQPKEASSQTTASASREEESDIPASEPETVASTREEEPTVSMTEPVPANIAAENGDGSTFMIYMVGSDLESQGSMATIDLDEIARSGIDASANNVLVCTGGSSSWTYAEDAHLHNNILRLADDRSGYDLLTQTETPQNMCEPEMLADFLNFCTIHYPSDHYTLILWDHGGGPLFGFGDDELCDHDTMSLSEMQEAMEQTMFRDIPLDLVVFDACLMASIEVADVWKNYARYFIASQETLPGMGLDYSFLAAANESSDPVQLGKEIIRQTKDFYLALDQEQTLCRALTLSLLDLDKIPTLLQSMDKLFASMDSSLSQGNYPVLAQLRSKTKKLALVSYGGKDNSLDLVDLGDFAVKTQHLFPAESSALDQALGDCVLYQTSNVDDVHGLSLYYPYDAPYLYGFFWDPDNPPAFSAGQDLLSQIQSQVHVREYMKKAQDHWLNGASQAAFDFTDLSNQEEEIRLKLTPAELGDVSLIHYTLLLQEGPYYAPVLQDVQLEPDKNGEVCISKGQPLLTLCTDQESGKEPVPVRQVEHGSTTDSYVTESVRLLNGLEDYVQVGPDQQIAVDFSQNLNSGEVYINEYRLEAADPYQNLPGRNEISLTGWKRIGYRLKRYLPLYDQEGNITPFSYWEEDRQGGRIGELPLNDSLHLEGVPVKAQRGSYVCQIVIEDVYGFSHASPLIPVS